VYVRWEELDLDGSDSSPMDFMFRSEDHLKVTVKPPVERERDQRRTKEISPVQDENVAQT